MTRHDMLVMLRSQLSDIQGTGWPTDEELTAYLDRATDYISDQAIEAKDPVMRKALALVDETELPEDFVRFVGHVPVEVEGRIARGDGTWTYFARLPQPSTFNLTDDDLPYTNQQALKIIDRARIYALNRNEYDVSQDITLR